MYGWKPALGVVAGVAAVGGLSLAGATSLWTKCYDPSLMASWVQAVGSIGAILGAFAVSQTQLRHERSKAADETAERIAVGEREADNLFRDAALYLHCVLQVAKQAYLTGGRFVDERVFDEILSRITLLRQATLSERTLEMLVGTRVGVVVATELIRRHAGYSNIPLEVLDELERLAGDARGRMLGKDV